MEKENELKHGPRTTIIAARRATGSVANLTRKFVGLSTTVVPHSELEKIDEKDKIDEKSTEPAADLGAQKHHVSDQSGSINAMLAEGQKELKKNMIIYPNSTFKLSWDLTIMMLSVWYTFMIPYRLAFISTVERWSALWVIDGSTFSIFNIIFYIDLPINFCTAVKEVSYGELKDNHRDIAVVYIQSWFLIDLVTCFPFETLTEESDGAEGANLAKSFKLIRLIKTLRILRATRVLKKVLEFIQFNPNKLRLLGLLSTLVVVLHWMACMYWLVSDFEVSSGVQTFDREQSGEDEAFNFWVPPKEMLDKNYTSNFQQYLYSIFWAVMVVTGIGRDVQPVSILEHLFSIVMIIIGVVV